ncbi:MAG: electron transport complex subunit RsxC [Oscillospiraceae bacterium]|nr:electron transport complex subunit RsxC [Oscillospiraceae bacterium]
MAIIKNRRRLPGIHPKYHKRSNDAATVAIPTPKTVVIPMQQHIGAEATPTVKPGDTVFVGQKIGDSDAAMSVPIHSSVSGTVKEIQNSLRVDGRMVKSVVIETDGEQTLLPEHQPIHAANRAEFLQAVRESGLVGLGGAGFPTHMKLAYKEIDKVDTLIINGAECEPYITSDYRECIENPEDIIEGIKKVMHYLDLTKCVIGIENNKPDAIALLSKLTDGMNGVSVMALKTVYPQGAEKVLIYSTTGKILQEGMLPADCGAIVMNISTVAELARYFRTGIPLITRRLTVDGSAVKSPRNLRVPIGITVREVLEYCEVDPESCEEILMGGPMMGVAVSDINTPIIKNNNAILAFTQAQVSYDRTSACIRCGKCVRTCPVKLMPASLERAYDNRDAEALQKLKINLCINCGCCSYICPAKRDLAAKNQLAKQFLREKQTKK